MNEKTLIGLLNIETDWDFGVKIRNQDYIGHKETIKIYSVDELEKLEYLGPFGAPASEHTKLWEIKEAIAAILKEPTKRFCNTGGNRGADWFPITTNE